MHDVGDIVADTEPVDAGARLDNDIDIISITWYYGVCEIFSKKGCQQVTCPRISNFVFSSLFTTFTLQPSGGPTMLMDGNEICDSKDGVSASTTSSPTFHHLQLLRRSTDTSHLAKS